MKNKICCFTGHRDITDCDKIRQKVLTVVNRLINSGVDTFICGGAKGFDLMCANIVADLKEEGEDIRLIHAIPHKGQANAYSISEREVYDYVLSMSDKIVILSENYYNGCMHARNRYMVDNSGYIISYCNKSSGGSFYTKEYARKKGLDIIEISTLLN